MFDEVEKVKVDQTDYGSIRIEKVGGFDSSKPSISQRFSITYIGAVFIVASAAVFVINEAYKGSLNQYFYPNNLRKVSTDDDSGIPTWTLYRSGYDPLNYFQSDASAFLKYKFLKDYVAIVEPQALNHLYVEGFGTGDDDGPSKYYEWEACINGKQCKQGSLHRDFNTGAILPCDSFAEYEITVTEYEASGKATGVTDSGTAVCVYVRREIRALTESDLNATMNAMATLWYTNEEEGRAKYGDNFHNSTYLASAHYFGAGQQDADHIHEGLGFLLQHIKLTNVFELSIQAVDPSVSLPYWDFTIDTAEGTSIYDLMIFQENTFGTLTPPGDTYWGWIYSSNSIDDAKIPNGRWANLKSEKNIWYPTMRNGYGYLRAPWNMNPSPYITRFVSEHDFPPCSSYKTWLMKSDLMMFLKYSPGPVHASTHGNIGGSFGCDYLDWMTKAGYLTKSYQKALCSKWGFKMKDLYRQNFLEPKKGCVINSDDVNLSECGFDCVPSRLGGMVAALNDTMSLYFGVDAPVKTWTAVRDFICEGDGYRVFFGDHLESASAADPSFWPIHPTMERAMQAKFMAGGFETTDWYTDYIEDWICGRNECYEPTLGPSKDYYPQCCSGHYRDDGIIDYVSGNKSNSIGLTNQEVIDFTDPTNKDYGMPYIYDSFSYSHCTDDDFDGFLEDLYWGNIVLSDDDDQTYDLDPFSYLDIGV